MRTLIYLSSRVKAIESNNRGGEKITNNKLLRKKPISVILFIG